MVQAINVSSSTPVGRLTVNGGTCQNNFLMQFQADVLGIEVERPIMRDTTVQGTAFAAGLAVGFWKNHEALMQQRQIERVFEPGNNFPLSNFATWQKAVKRTLAGTD